ncbi:MAG: hypothetical protein HRU20_15750 [Pseudomonadales bacterium]|nr:hypothetical protein [Pseudomonadales bacterium]
MITFLITTSIITSFVNDEFAETWHCNSLASAAIIQSVNTTTTQISKPDLDTLVFSNTLGVWFLKRQSKNAIFLEQCSESYCDSSGLWRGNFELKRRSEKSGTFVLVSSKIKEGRTGNTERISVEVGSCIKTEEYAFIPEFYRNNSGINL